MKIAIDARTITEQRFGIGFYTYWLIDALSNIDKENSYYIFALKNNIDKFKLQSNFNIIETSIKIDSHPSTEIWENIVLNKILKEKNIHVFHNPSFRVPFFYHKKVKIVVTLHDLIPFIYPDVMPKKFAIYMKINIKHALKTSDTVIVDSISTKNDILKYFIIDEKKIKVVYPAVGGLFKICDKKLCQEVIKEKLNVDRNFILFVSRLEPRKNVIRLIKAYSALKRKNDYMLFIVGAQSWRSEEIFRLTEELGLLKNVLFLDYIDDDLLVKLYNTASLFILPSLYEGFGFTVLEAMACGCPVITSNVSSLPEITGDSAILIDPYNIDEIKDAMEELIENKSLKDKLVEKGLKNVQRFSWENTAKKMLEVYKELL